MANGTRCRLVYTLFSGWLDHRPRSIWRRSKSEGPITAAAFFVTTEDLSCNRLLPSTLCNALPNCLLKLTDGRQVEGHGDVITFRGESNICAVDNQTPPGFQECITTSMHDQYTPILDGGGIRVDSGDSRLSDAAQPTCSDGVQNGDESDVDCGGTCEPCDLDARCRNESDCTSRHCLDMICTASDCNDTLQNGDETDVDCGGRCGGCPNLSQCNSASDCVSNVCDNDVCQPPQCDDGVKNGLETGTDCGGECTDCNACEGSTDCEAGFVCITNLCSPPSQADKRATCPHIAKAVIAKTASVVMPGPAVIQPRIARQAFHRHHNATTPSPVKAQESMRSVGHFNVIPKRPVTTVVAMVRSRTPAVPFLPLCVMLNERNPCLRVP